VQLTSGELRIGGALVLPRTPNEAQKLGVAMVFQETSLVPTMTVAQHLFLDQERFFNRRS
jgi:simple sugar transport system ATP-binding protein